MKKYPLPSRYIIYNGEELGLHHINWDRPNSKEKQWQCNWIVASSKTKITYGETPEDAFEKMKVLMEKPL